VNTLKTSVDALMMQLTEQGIGAEPHPWCPECLVIRGSGSLEQLDAFREGLFYVQDPAARMAAMAADLKPGMRVLDCCSAPGGKSFASAIAMENRGEIISCDLHEKKLGRIRENAERLGFSIIHTQAMDGSQPYEEFRKSFDLVIADVPCSGLGVIRKKPEIRYKPQADIQRLPEVQLRILRGLSSCVKAGGILLYSTCTILREENEAVVEAFLQEGHPFTVEEMRTLWPHKNGTDGFFICRMRHNG